MKNKLNIFLLLISLRVIFSQNMGLIRGTVIDAESTQPLIGVNVFIEETNLGDATDVDGFFQIEDIPVGTRHIHFQMIGYEPRQILNILVSQARPIELEIKLSPKPIEIGAVEVQGKTFSKSSGATLSTFNVDQAELRSDPVGVYDVQQMMQNLPSVSNASNDQENEIISRGGMPGENLFLMDRIEIPNPNHFGLDGSGGGPINMINPLFVREIEFTPGVFSAKYGDKASSVMDIVLRNGSRKSFEYDFNLNMAGAGMNIEGPIDEGRGSFIASSNWSYLEYVMQSTGMTAIPSYNNHQAKIIYDIDNNNQLSLNILAGFDAIHIKDENKVVSKGVESVNHNGHTILGGVNFRTIFGKTGYRNITFSSVLQEKHAFVYDFPNENDSLATRDNILLETTFKSDWVFNFDWGQLLTGASAKLSKTDYDEWAEADTTFIYDTTSTFWNGGEGFWDFPEGIVEPSVGTILFFQDEDWKFKTKDKSIKLSNYIQMHIPVGEKSKVSVGLRLDYFDVTDELVFSPRFNWESKLNSVTTIHGGLGRHYQYPEFFMLFGDSQGRNKSMRAKFTNQLVFGVEHFFAYDFKGSIETFYKEYENIPTKYCWNNISEESNCELDHLSHWETDGVARSYGVEFFLQKKLTNNWHSLMSYTWSKSQGKDIRNIFTEIASNNDESTENDWYDWDFDFEHQLTIVAGWKSRLWEKQWYRDIRDKWWLSALGPLNPLADEIELTVRYVYMGGRPFTEKTYKPTLYSWEINDDIPWNGQRYSPYQRFDVMFLQRYHFEKFNIVTYIDFINVFNRDNIWDWSYNNDGTKMKVYQYKTMPIGGITVEF